MKIPDRKLFIIINGVLLVALLWHSVYRDIRMQNRFPTDLRNRVVGARLQKDGKLPYSYNWQPSDGIRYFDVHNSNPHPSGINNITASPFFHELLFPICDLPEKSLSEIWLALQYIFLAAMIFMLCGLTNESRKKWLIVNVGILFTVTEAWKTLIGCGQLYFFVGFLVCCTLTLLIRNYIVVVCYRLRNKRKHSNINFLID